jgi:hypothetical protein
MMKAKILTFIAIVLTSVTLLCIPTLATGLEWTETIVYFHVLGFDEVRVTIIGDAAWTSTNSTGNLTAQSLNFTCATDSCSWVNASFEGASGTQDDTTPAIGIDNTGTTNAEVNISVNETLPGATCFNLRYVNDTDNTLDTYPPVLHLNTTNITLDSSFTPAEADIDVWLFGNFSDCTAQTYPLKFYVFADFA